MSTRLVIVLVAVGVITALLVTYLLILSAPPVNNSGAVASKKDTITELAEAKVDLEDRQKELGQLKEDLGKHEETARKEAEVIAQNRDGPDKVEVKVYNETTTLGRVRNSLYARLAEIELLKSRAAKTAEAIVDLQKKVRELSPPERRNDIPSDTDLLKKVENLGPPATKPAS